MCIAIFCLIFVQILNWIYFISGILVAAFSAAILYVVYKIQRKQHQPVVPQREIETITTEPVREEPTTEQDFSDEIENLKGKINNLFIVNDLGQKVTSSLNLEESFRYLFHTLNSMMDAAVVELRVLGKTDSKLYTNLNSVGNTFLNDDYLNPVSEWCIQNKKDAFLADAISDYARYVHEPLIIPGGKTAASILAFPVFLGTEISGSLCVVSFTKNSFTEYHQSIVQMLLGYISVALQNALTHEELNVTKIRAEKSEKVKEMFLASMSHEIRTPINAVTGMTRLLIDKNPRQDQLQYLQSIQKASESLMAIINDVLDMSKIEAGKMELEETDFSVKEVLDNVQNIMQFKAEEKGLTLGYTIASDFPAVLKGDPTRLTQVLLNLTGNAIKFTEKGKVNIDVSSEDSDTMNTKCTAHFAVSDTGIGIPEDEAQRLFQNYSQAAPGTSRKYGGTGLGLSISKQLIELQDGSIEVKSTAGKGSIFSFKIPYEKSISQSVNARKSKVSGEMIEALRGIHILSADDNEYNRILLKETLESRIPEVVIDEAFDGLEVLEKLSNGNLYDLILMDLIMPNLDGFETAKKIRHSNSEATNRIPLIAFTASVVKSEIDRSFEAGMNAFVPKPFTEEQLILALYHTLYPETADTFKEQSITIDAGSIEETNQPSEVLGKFLSDPERTKRYLKMFCEMIPSRLESLATAIIQQNFSGARVIAHSMKPQFAISGNSEAAQLLEKIEQDCQIPENHSQIPHLYHSLQTIAEQILIESNEMLLKLSADLEHETAPSSYQP